MVQLLDPACAKQIYKYLKKKPNCTSILLHVNALSNLNILLFFTDFPISKNLNSSKKIY